MRIREADNTPHDERDAQQDDADDETPYGKTRRGDERDASRDVSRDDRRDARNPKCHDESTSGTTGANGPARSQRPDETTRENELTKTAHYSDDPPNETRNRTTTRLTSRYNEAGNDMTRPAPTRRHDETKSDKSESLRNGNPPPTGAQREMKRRGWQKRKRERGGR